MTAWMERAGCLNQPVDVMFPTSGSGRPNGVYEAAVERAVSICRTCTVVAECQAWAETERPVEGVYAGQVWKFGRPASDIAARRRAAAQRSKERAR